ncbi:MAG: hybrid sensor histidine kinase/response regulator [Bacteroidetes bacterium]|nr:hybrid sensor histidine kinase/response regulator [Bacteroidota bacterium]MBT6686216.1 hybrid sensor histidine kinase/response regulator [Bacteroidota bacterium]MBT7144289.1 hybrid sensor histidine kinase/response regulator [Bacteroidota bacterium]MBT7493508.1 hybrid sensor histidine kinase/response regulator [Bacteroidota bacterium]
MKRYKILLVDDNEANLNTVFNIINASDEPYDLIQANSGRVACNIAFEEDIDLIIMDWDMPAMTGIEALKILKEDKRTKHIPVIMFTGVMTTSENLMTALDAGAVDYIRKPIDKIELIARIRSMLTLAESFKKIERQKKQISEQNIDLKKMNETKDKFFSIIAHDLKSPFNALLGFADMLNNQLAELSASELKHIVKIMHKSAHNAFKLIENLLEWAKMQTGSINFTPRIINVNVIVNSVVQLMQMQASFKKIKIINNILPNTKVHADTYMVESVLRNLITNSIKYTHQGGQIYINSTLDNNFLEIAITDTGVGIRKEDINKLFKINEKHRSFGTENEEGSGIGLILCKEFINKNGGEIWVESEIDKGSSFKFTLPLIS